MADPLLTTSPDPATRPAPAMKTRPVQKPHARNSPREIAETVVFVVALVLMLKLFVVEAFVIPTGSMAETLYGYQKIVTCPECGFDYPVNSSDEVAPADGRPRALVGACCPNCRFRVEWGRSAPAPANQSGDRVLVHKALYSFHPPDRGDVVVFKYPVDPQLNGELQNYIKRLWGLGGETIAINGGDLYRTTGLTYPDEARPADPLDAWYGPETYEHSKTAPPFKPAGFDPRTRRGPDYTYHNAAPARGLFAASRDGGFAGPVDDGFVLIRKADSEVLAMRRIVYDNDHQSAYLAEHGVPPRWAFEPDAGWTADGPANMPAAFAHTGDGLGWVRYRHLVPHTEAAWEKLAGGYQPDLLPPSVITNYMGYNSGVDPVRGSSREAGEQFWVGDLILETEATFAAEASEVVMELSKGRHRYQAWFAGGTVRLVRTGPNGRDLATRPSGIDGPGTYDLRFANVDCRLRVWVNGTAVDFGDDAELPARAAARDVRRRRHDGGRLDRGERRGRPGQSRGQGGGDVRPCPPVAGHVLHLLRPQPPVRGRGPVRGHVLRPARPLPVPGGQ